MAVQGLVPVLGVTDLDRSLDLYCGVLGLRQAAAERGDDGAGERRVLWSHGRQVVLEVVADPGDRGWLQDDLQVGMRHVAFRVDDVDRWAGRVRQAGMRFTMEPREAMGRVRICFFLDPDGAQVELVQRHVRYSRPGSGALIRAERAEPVPAAPRFDHVAVSVADRERSLAFYGQGVGAELIGELDAPDDPRGFRIAYLQVGNAVLEVFSYSLPMLPGAHRPGRPGAGLGRIAVQPGETPETVLEALLRAGALPVETPGDAGPRTVLDPDGTPLEVRALGGAGAIAAPQIVD